MAYQNVSRISILPKLDVALCNNTQSDHGWHMPLLRRLGGNASLAGAISPGYEITNHHCVLLYYKITDTDYCFYWIDIDTVSATQREMYLH